MSLPSRPCDRCRSAFVPGSNRALYCGPKCRREARTEYEERRVTAAYAGARFDPRLPGVASAADAADALTDEDGSPAYGVSTHDRAAYLDARRAYLDALAAMRKRYRMTRLAGGWRIPPPESSACAGCPILNLPVQSRVSDELEAHALAAERRRLIAESL